MAGKINFVHDRVNAVVIATPKWELNTRGDVIEWYRQYETYFTKNFSRKVDLIIDLTDFHVTAKFGAIFGEYRVRMLTAFTNHSYRVKADRPVMTFVSTSAVLHNGPANNFQTLDAALKALRADREATR